MTGAASLYKPPHTRENLGGLARITIAMHEKLGLAFIRKSLQIAGVSPRVYCRGLRQV